MSAVVRVLEFGDRKYGPDNWRQVPDLSERYFNAMMRHLVSWRSGELADADTGESHLAHVVCCALFILGAENGE